MRGIPRHPLRVSAQRVARCIPSSSSLPIPRPGRRKVSVLAQETEAITEMAWKKNPLPPPISTLTQEPPQRIRLDPYTLVAPELKQIRSNLLNLLGSAHPSLTEIADLYFLHPSKQLRSLLVLLFSHATNGLGEEWERKQWEASTETYGGRGAILDKPLYSSGTLNEWNPSMPDDTESFAAPFDMRRISPPLKSFTPPLTPTRIPPTLANSPVPLPTQMRLAQIVEMIHIASLLHEDIFNSVEAPSSSENPFGNKLAILGGDFLLGRASTVLSRLGESEVVELVASVISNLVEGEFLQMSKVQTPSLGVIQGPQSPEEAWDLYMQKTYLKSASLMAKGARAGVILGGCTHTSIWKEVAYSYGRNLGIANQLINDSMEYETSGSSGLSPGLATAPAIYAWDESPDIKLLIQRNFAKEGDIELALDIVRRTSGVERTRVLAYDYAERAREVLKMLPDSDAKMALEELTEQVRQRNWS